MDIKLREKYELAMRDALKKVDMALPLFTSRFPHVSSHLIYTPEENKIWTASFFPGIVNLAYDYTGDSKYLKHQEEYLDSFEYRLNNKIKITHDLGFLYTLSCVALYKLTGNKRAYRLANQAADVLATRFHEKGQYIQAWGEMGDTYPDVKIIIDTMLNLPLLYWSKDERNKKIAAAHAKTSAKYLVREDYSSFHTYLMNPETGEGVVGKTHQGFRDDSTWARGQGWTVYGYVLSYRYTKNEEFLRISENAADYYIKHLPKNYIPYWDFSFTDEIPDIRDTSAAAILCCGLLELCKYVEKKKAEEYETVVHKIMNSLIHDYTTKDVPESTGLLKEGMYHRTNGANECVIWGDYYYMEALLRLLKDWNLFW